MIWGLLYITPILRNPHFRTTGLLKIVKFPVISISLSAYVRDPYQPGRDKPEGILDTDQSLILGDQQISANRIGRRFCWDIINQQSQYGCNWLHNQQIIGIWAKAKANTKQLKRWEVNGEQHPSAAIILFCWTVGCGELKRDIGRYITPFLIVYLFRYLSSKQRGFEKLRLHFSFAFFFGSYHFQ